jgi:hypothetical protein
MAFTVPTFNLTCNIYSNTTTWPAVPRLTAVCNLAVGSKIRQNFSALHAWTVFLLLPKLTDIRGPVNASPGADVVECPAGSGRTYSVLSVEDVGKGFPNEYRCAMMLANPIGAHFWPTPIP